MAKLLKRNSWQPERLVPSRVERFYRGGSRIGRLHGVEEPDGDRPEEWIGSVTTAFGEAETGLSRLEDGRLLRDAITADPEAWLGREHVERYGTSTGVLVKLLDSAERLPVHAHPDRRFASERLGSPFGKTEAWIVLATRDAASDVWVGLARDVERDTYRGWIERQDAEALLASLHRAEVRAGDVVYVPAGVPHAIGAGAFVAEVQEATDLSLVCEWRDFPIDPDASHLGLGWDVAVEALDLRIAAPVFGLPPEARTFFWADEKPEAVGRFAVLLVCEGSGAVGGAAARPGDGFAVPAAVEGLEVEGDLRLLRFLAPE
ncbi:MAG TPA: class I mannose-6-phosphate isomerase [Gaiellaceae bacterium]|nr:class I mannose-6-phosphate isomerase [Gaiellaceae bacterium]